MLEYKVALKVLSFVYYYLGYSKKDYSPEQAKNKW